MKGLCHFCFKTNANLFITKGKVQCENCKNGNVPEKKEKKEEVKLPFEDLPQGTVEERARSLEMIMADLNEKNFARYLKNERISEPLIDRIHET